eukprot:714999-Hanusia_phi.AAC.2
MRREKDVRRDEESKEMARQDKIREERKSRRLGETRQDKTNKRQKGSKGKGYESTSFPPLLLLSS